MIGFLIFWGLVSIIPIVILYYIIKIAVRNAIIEAKQMELNTEHFNGTTDEGSRISQIKCPNCSASHDMDFPKCPYCKHMY